MREKSLTAFKDKVRAKTGRTRGDSLERIISTARFGAGFEFFKSATPIPFRSLDGFIRRPLRSILRKGEKRPGFGRCRADQQRWPNAYFADRGLFTL